MEQFYLKKFGQIHDITKEAVNLDAVQTIVLISDETQSMWRTYEGKKVFSEINQICKSDALNRSNSKDRSLRVHSFLFAI